MDAAHHRSGPRDAVGPMRRAHLPAAARVLATALADDPGYRHLLPDGARRVGELTALYRMTLADALRYGHGLVGAVGPVVTSALAIYPPAGYPMTAARWALVAPRLALLGARAREHSRGLARFGRLTAPAVPADAWYVEAVGVRPDLQRAGRGTALVEAALALVDAGGGPSYLETTNPQNAAYYERFGYRRFREPVPLSPAGPAIVAMLRPAR